jgi:O-antigen/teichoic acid export membrane protein
MTTPDPDQQVLAVNPEQDTDVPSSGPPEKQGNSRSQRLLKNTVSQLGSRVGSMLIGLVLTPYSLNRIGLTSYGIWTFVATITTYVAVLDPGLGTIVTRYAASHRVHNKDSVTARMIALAVLGYVAIGVLLAPAAYFVFPFLAHHLNIPPGEVKTASGVFIAGYGLFFSSSIALVLSQALTGLGDLWLSSLIDFFSRSIYAIVAFTLLATGSGVWGLVIANYAQVVVIGVCGYVACRRRMTAVFGNPFRLGRALVSELSLFGGSVQLIGVMQVIGMETDPIVIGAAISVADVGVYNVAGALAAQVQYLPTTLLTAALPAATDAHERGDTTFVRTFSVQASRVAGLLSLLTGGSVLAVSPLAFKAWFGRSYPHLELIFAFLTLSYVLNNLGGIPGTVLLAVGRPGIAAKNAVLGAIVNVVATIAFAIPFGLLGVMIGTILGVAVKTSVLLWKFYRHLELRLGRDLVAWLVRLAVATLLPALVVRLLIHLIPARWWSDRAGALGCLAGAAVLYLIITITAIKLVRFFRADDHGLFLALLPRRLSGAVESRFFRWFVGASASEGRPPVGGPTPDSVRPGHP